MARGRKKRTNIRKQVVRNPATLAQTIRRRVLFTAGSGVDSTTTDGGLPAGFVAVFGPVGASLAGGAGTPERSWFTLLSTSRPSLLITLTNTHTSTPQVCATTIQL